MNDKDAEHENAMLEMFGQSIMDYDASTEETAPSDKKIRVRVCGKTIWNHPSERSMARGGWLHYSIIAQGSSLGDAIRLCRSWSEFWNLNILAIF